MMREKNYSLNPADKATAANSGKFGYPPKFYNGESLTRSTPPLRMEHFVDLLSKWAAQLCATERAPEQGCVYSGYH